MLETGWFTTAEDWVETHVLSAHDFATFGFAMAAILCLVLIFLIGSGIGSLVTRMRNVAGARAFRRSKEAGYRILLARPTGPGAGRGRKWLTAAIQDHLAEFNFGAPFRVVGTGQITGDSDQKMLAQARKRLATADADMLVWATRIGKDADGFVVQGLSRGGGLRADEARAFSIPLPGRFAALEGEMSRVAAYLLAKKLQPALSNPQAFRPEKMKVLAEALDAMLAGADAAVPAVRAELEADFCASGVHVAEAMGDLAALDRVIALRRSHLEAVDATSDSALVLQARMDLGRALLARAEKQFDQKTVQEAISQLSQVVEALRGDPSIQKAQTASDAMFKAQTMIETRKRFSMNFGS
ncbi:MAG: hypothetical protein KJ871_12150 [Alphaproteobacteria bacterium]|nr:hypothetical protein [Alphaproteobacteria bacterium]MBU2084316.1 hypothetical protein [Alphaproteobacteria bacterium]MBU2143881.1 hypothetical protein [Alphaproteobacteria bacterium]MBU2197996.1 hypothetical protein [Alphaproteobacteria bacterium]